MGDSERGRVQNPPSPRKLQVAIDFLRNTGTDPSREAIGPFIGPKGSNCFSREVRRGLCEIR